MDSVDKISINRQYVGEGIDWNVGGLFTHDEFWILLLNELNNVNVAMPFQYIYGTPFNIRMGGGRIQHHMDDNALVYNLNTLKEYNKLGIGCRLTLSNHLLQERDFEDDDLNIILGFLNRKQHNGVILTDDRFNQYIKYNYPNLQRICSVIRPAIDVGWGNEDATYYNNLCEKYDTVVLNCGFAKDINNINQLEYKEKVEVLVNTSCTLNCKLAKTHYDLIAEEYLTDLSADGASESLSKRSEELNEQCRLIKSQNAFGGANFSVNEVQNLIDNGIHHFKLEGRSWPVTLVLKDVGYYICDKVMFDRVCKNVAGVPIQ